MGSLPLFGQQVQMSRHDSTAPELTDILSPVRQVEDFADLPINANFGATHVSSQG